MPKNVKNTTFAGLLDLIAPHSCRGCGHIGNVLCDRCKKYIMANQLNLCPVCKEPNPTGICPNCPDLPPVFTCGERSELLNAIIHDYKYQSIRALAHPLAEFMNHALPIPDRPTIIVPLPTATNHIRSRGFDHTKLIAKHLTKLQGSNVHLNQLLTRTSNTTQVGTNRTTRLTQAEHTYSLTSDTPLDPSITYILFDDVWTTGASMRTCIKKLRLAGAHRIIVALLAVSRIN